MGLVAISPLCPEDVGFRLGADRKVGADSHGPSPMLACHRRPHYSARPSSLSPSAFHTFLPHLRSSPSLWQGKLPNKENALFFPERSPETRPSRSLGPPPPSYPLRSSEWKVLAGLLTRFEGFWRASLFQPLVTFCKHQSPAGNWAVLLNPWGFLVRPSSSGLQ